MDVKLFFVFVFVFSFHFLFLLPLLLLLLLQGTSLYLILNLKQKPIVNKPGLPQVGLVGKRWHYSG